MSVWNDLKLVNLASSASFNKGISYYQSNAVLSREIIGEGVYIGKVSGSGNKIYDVKININHPRKSSCTCPFAAGRRVVCKHMVALYFSYFPTQANTIIAEWEEEERQEEERYLKWEKAYTIFRQEKLNEVTTYVNDLSEKQVREKLIEALLNKFDRDYPDYDEDYFDYYDDEEYGDDDYYF